MLANAIKKRLSKLGKEEKGFTLIELLAVIVILGIIAVIAIPMIGNVIDKSRQNADLATARQIYDAARLYTVTENLGKNTSGQTLVTLATLQSSNYLENNLVLPSTKAPLNATETVVTFNANGELVNVKVAPASTKWNKDGIYSSAELQAMEINTSASPNPSPSSGG